MNRPFAYALIFLSAAPALADDVRLPARPDPVWQEECGSCHIAFPPSLLSAGDWRAVMQGLDRHYGVDATLDEPTRARIAAFLEASAGRGRKVMDAPNLRITQTRWFLHEHDEVPARVWSDPQVKGAANCGACHGDAQQGRFDEHAIRMPFTGGRTR
jgi:mono/diheme cytochrome c family protein